MYGDITAEEVTEIERWRKEHQGSAYDKWFQHEYAACKSANANRRNAETELKQVLEVVKEMGVVLPSLGRLKHDAHSADLTVTDRMNTMQQISQLMMYDPTCSLTARFSSTPPKGLLLQVAANNSTQEMVATFREIDKNPLVVKLSPGLREELYMHYLRAEAENTNGLRLACPLALQRLKAYLKSKSKAEASGGGAGKGKEKM